MSKVEDVHQIPVSMLIKWGLLLTVRTMFDSILDDQAVQKVHYCYLSLHCAISVDTKI